MYTNLTANISCDLQRYSENRNTKLSTCGAYGENPGTFRQLM